MVPSILLLCAKNDSQEVLLFGKLHSLFSSSSFFLCSHIRAATIPSRFNSKFEKPTQILKNEENERKFECEKECI